MLLLGDWIKDACACPAREKQTLISGALHDDSSKCPNSMFHFGERVVVFVSKGGRFSSGFDESISR